MLENSQQEPVISRSRKGFSQICFLGCVTSEPLEIVAQILKNGYIPRENIDLHMEVRNKSNQPVLEFTIQLIQVSVKLLKIFAESDMRRSYTIR